MANEVKTPIPARLYNAAVGGHVAGADDIIDDKTGMVVSELVGNKPATSEENPFNGMGVVVLPMNIQEVEEDDTTVQKNILTQAMMNQANTKYVIKYDYTLGEDITVPANCVLEFDGGGISGYSLGFNNTTLSGDIKIRNCSFSGTLSNYKVNINWFHDTEDDIADTLQYLISAPRHIIINKGLWYVSKSSKITVGDIRIEGEGKSVSTIKVTDTAASGNIWLLATDYEYEWDYIRNVTIEDDMNINIRNIHISDITFNMNHGGVDSSLLSTLRTYVMYLRNVENCIIERCSFVDSMTYESNNGEPAITTLLCKNIVVRNCYSNNITLFGPYHSINCVCSDNYGEQSVGTWFEPAGGYGNVFKNNILKGGCFWNVSIVGINSKNCVVENNIIEQGSYDNVSGLTLGHTDGWNGADNTIVKNNVISVSGASYAIFGQSIDNGVIENNNISGNVTQYAIKTGTFCKILNNKIVTSSGTQCVNCGNDAIICGNIIEESNGKGIYVSRATNVTMIECNDIKSKLASVTVVGKGAVKNNVTSNIIVTKGPIINNTINKGTNSFTLPPLYFNGEDIEEIRDNVVNVENGDSIDTFIAIISNNIFSNEGTLYKQVLLHVQSNVINGTYETTKYLVISNNLSQSTFKKEFVDQFGTTRPNLNNTLMYGYNFFDLNINKPIYYTSNGWVDATGATV